MLNCIERASKGLRSKGIGRNLNFTRCRRLCCIGLLGSHNSCTEFQAKILRHLVVGFFCLESKLRELSHRFLLNVCLILMFSFTNNSFVRFQGSLRPKGRRLSGLSYLFAGISILLSSALALSVSSPTRIEELRRKGEERREESSQEIVPVSGFSTISAKFAGDDPGTTAILVVESAIQQILFAPASEFRSEVTIIPFVDLPFDPRPSWRSNLSPPAVRA